MTGIETRTRRCAAETMGRMRRLHFVGIGGAGMNGIAGHAQSRLRGLGLGYQTECCHPAAGRAGASIPYRT